MNERVAETLRLMRENAVRALDYAREHPGWRTDDLVVDAIAKRVEQVTELAKYRIPRALRGDYPDIPWDGIAGMRDRLVHDYSNVDVEMLAGVLADDLPDLVRGSIDCSICGKPPGWNLPAATLRSRCHMRVTDR